ncbi:MAG: SDR family oxidoreductase [Actinomycetes bacterium]|jgi:ketoreductase RED2
MGNRDLNGSVVLVTGSSSGIGEATARQFDAMGASVVINSSSSVDAGEAIAASLRDGSYVQSAVGSEESAAALISAVLDRHGRLDVLVNNAGTTAVIPHADIEAADLEVWRRIFEVNVFGTWAVTAAALPALRSTEGSIVNVSSIAGLRPTGSSIPYAASKAALNHMTTLLAKVVGPQVRVNAVAPGLVDTPWTKDWDVIREFVTAVAPLRRSATPEDIAEVIVDLAVASFVTGQVVTVDGGLTLAT